LSEHASWLPTDTLVPTRHYTLVCSLCGTRRDDDGIVLDCTEEHAPALLRTEYVEGRFSPRSGWDGLFRYREWLPVVRTRPDVGRSAVYRSRELARELGLANLWIAFNGYWPERGATLETATFKEFEAYTVLGRLPEQPLVLTVASSGNTGAAFAWACSQQRQPCLLVVPGSGLSRLRFRTALDPCVTVVVIDDGDYADAIELAAVVARLPWFQLEGGVRNVARRDGLASVVLSAVEELRQLPSHYFQAVGSGTGAIAALEAARRLLDAGLPGPLPRLMLGQNQPFVPIDDLWRGTITSIDDQARERYRGLIDEVHADELTNVAPPFALTGGVRDALQLSGGEVMVTDNGSVRKAQERFLALEGMDIEPAAGVAVACLAEAAAQDRIDPDAVVLLNITGGGRARLARDHVLVPVTPRLRLSRADLARGDAVLDIVELCTR
jgi:cysteate synthase